MAELLYMGDFSYVVDHPNDHNGHLKCSDYFDYAERARYDWLNAFGWSDIDFNKNGIAQNRRRWENPVPEHFLPVKNGDLIRVNMVVSAINSRKFSMLFKYYNSGNQLVFETGSTNFFGRVEQSDPGRLTKIIMMPDFFLKTLREHRDKI